MNFEIRIYANPSGYKEIKLKALNGTYRLCTDDIIQKRNYDGERGLFPDGTFSVFYTPNGYVIGYKFSLPPDANFRDNEARIVVALPRGYKLINPTATISALADEFSRIASEYKEEAERNTYANTEKFYEFVASRVEQDFTQFNINTIGSYTKRGILAVDSNEELDKFLEDPFRAELKGTDIIFVLLRNEASKLANLISSGMYSAIRRLGPKTYTLVYPNGKRVPFSSLNVDLPAYSIRRPYEKELEFSGSLKDNFDKWQISISSDKTEYIIGIKPEQEEKEVKIAVVDKHDGNLLKDVNVRVCFGAYYLVGKWILSGEEIGRYESDVISIDNHNISKDGEWILPGEEIGRYNKPTAISVDGYNIKNVKCIGYSLTIYVAKRYTYDILSLISYIKKETGCEVPVMINGQDRSGRNVQYQYKKGMRTDFSLEIPPSSLYISVPATPTTEETLLRFDESGKVREFRLNKKQTREIVICFNAELTQVLKKKMARQRVAGTVGYTYFDVSHGEIKRERFIDYIPFEIKGLPTQEVQFEIKVAGYKTYKNYVDLSSHSRKIMCNLTPTIGTHVKKLCVTKLPLVLGGMVLGALICFYVLNFWNNLLPSNKDLMEEIATLRQDSISMAEKLNYMRIINAVEELPAVESPIFIETNEDSIVAVAQSTTESVIIPDNAQKELIEKLKGFEFTKKDIDAAKSSLNGLNQDELILDAEACLKILNLGPSEKTQITKKGSTTYNLTVNKLKAHQSIMQEIIKSDAYKSCTKKDFKTIAEMQKYIKENE